MPEDKNIIRISVDVDEEIAKQVDELAEKERWSRRVVLKVALENYLKLRGYSKDGN